MHNKKAEMKPVTARKKVSDLCKTGLLYFLAVVITIGPIGLLGYWLSEKTPWFPRRTGEEKVIFSFGEDAGMPFAVQVTGERFGAAQVMAEESPFRVIHPDKRKALAAYLEKEDLYIKPGTYWFTMFDRSDQIIQLLQYTHMDHSVEKDRNTGVSSAQQNDTFYDEPPAS